MGELPDDQKSTIDQAAEAFQTASRHVVEAVDAARQPDMRSTSLPNWSGTPRYTRSPSRSFSV